MPLLMDLSLIWDGMPWPVRSMRKVRWKALVWVPGMAFDPAFYYYRPVNVYAAHGYGPVLWAGAEMISLLKNQYPQMNDSAVQYYQVKQKTTAPIFAIDTEEKKD